QAGGVASARACSRGARGHSQGEGIGGGEFRSSSTSRSSRRHGGRGKSSFWARHVGRERDQAHSRTTAALTRRAMAPSSNRSSSTRLLAALTGLLLSASLAVSATALAVTSGGTDVADIVPEW